MKILVTGSSGHLGEAIIRKLNQNNIDSIGIDINPSEFTSHVGSISDKSEVNELMKKVDYVIHAATLHKPHVATHSHQEFVDTNISGTLNLLEAASCNKVKGFVFTSSTSTFGYAMNPKANEPAVWVSEELRPIPKNIYGVTKIAAEDLCQLFYQDKKLPCLILKTARFFPEEDDKKQIRAQYDQDNIKVLEYLNRRVDIEDVVSAHLLAVEKSQHIGFSKYIISATSPFQTKDLAALNADAKPVVRRLFPEMEQLFSEKGWKMLPKIDRVYDNSKARNELGWKPKYDFEYILNRLKEKKDFRSELAINIGKKGYHSEKFECGPYPTTDE